MSDFLHKFLPFVYYNPILTLAVLAVLLILSFIVDSKLKKINKKHNEKKLAELYKNMTL